MSYHIVNIKLNALENCSISPPAVKKTRSFVDRVKKLRQPSSATHESLLSCLPLSVWIESGSQFSQSAASNDFEASFCTLVHRKKCKKKCSSYKHLIFQNLDLTCLDLIIWINIIKMINCTHTYLPIYFILFLIVLISQLFLSGLS